MKLLEKISEDEVVALFLKTEITSARWSNAMLEALNADGKNRTIIDMPDVSNEQENIYRMDLLEKLRGYKSRSKLFGEFPEEVGWHRALVSKGELAEVKYIKWDYWSELTNGTRLPKDAVKMLAQKNDSSEEQYFRDIAAAIRRGAKFHPLILVGIDEDSPLVVLEGHARLTGYFYVPHLISEEMEVIIGFSDHMQEWSEY